MDFLPLPPHPGARYPEIPFVATLKLENSCLFGEFPETHGFRSHNHYLFDRSGAEVSDFVQSWLYFGVISEVLGEELNLNDYAVVKEDGSHVVKLHQLSARLQEIAGREPPGEFPASYNFNDEKRLARNGSNAECKDTGTASIDLTNQKLTTSSSPKRRRNLLNIRDCVVLARNSIVAIEELLPSTLSDKLDSVILSVRVLLEWLLPTSEAPISPTSQTIPPAARALRRTMISNGWCISQWYDICRSHVYEHALFLSALPRSMGSRIGHNKCTRMVCAACRSAGKVTPAHVELGCECANSRDLGQDAASVLLAGKLPLVLVEIEKRGQVSVAIKAWDSITPFTAISHVWSDGIGNSEKNTLPECQLRRLYEMITGLRHDLQFELSNPLGGLGLKSKHWFWLDTFCIPAGTFSFSRQNCNQDLPLVTERMAVDSMRYTYSYASLVLVLNPEVISLTTATDLAITLAYGSYCGWATRGWTLQEASLGRRLAFALSDGIFNPSQDVIGISNKKDSIVRDPRLSLFHSFSERRLNIDLRPSGSETEAEALRTAWNSLLRSHSSELKDLPLILATLMGFTASETFLFDRRIETILSSVQGLPLSFLYGNKDDDSRPVDYFDQNEGGIYSVAEEPQGQGLSTSSLLQKLSADPTVNRWMPENLSGNKVISGPYLEVLDSKFRLRMTKQQETGRGCCALASYDVQSVPEVFILKTAQRPFRPLTIKRVRQIHNSTFQQELQKITLGFCFILKGTEDDIFEKNNEVRGTLLAIVKDLPGQVTTIYHSVVCASPSPPEWVSYSIPMETLSINASSAGPEIMDIILNRKAAGPKLHKNHFNINDESLLSKFYSKGIRSLILCIPHTDVLSTALSLWPMFTDGQYSTALYAFIEHTVLITLYALFRTLIDPYCRKRQAFKHYCRTVRPKLEESPPESLLEYLVQSSTGPTADFMTVLCAQLVICRFYVDFSNESDLNYLGLHIMFLYMFACISLLFPHICNISKRAVGNIGSLIRRSRRGLSRT